MHVFAPLEAQVDAGPRGHLVRVRIGGKLAGVEDHVVRLAEIGQFGLGRSQQHVVHEQGMIGPSADHADFEAIAAGPSRRSRRDVNRVAGVEKVDRSLAVDDENVFGEADIDRAPPDIGRAGRMIDDPLIERAAAGLRAGADRSSAPLSAMAACSRKTACS